MKTLHIYKKALIIHRPNRRYLSKEAFADFSLRYTCHFLSQSVAIGTERIRVEAFVPVSESP